MKGFDNIGWPLNLGYKHFMTREERIREKLTVALAPTNLEIRDISDQHHGHAGWRESGETHFEVDIASLKFEGLTRVAAHRLVNDALADELDSGLHALQIRIIS
jgi:BolA protein